MRLDDMRDLMSDVATVWQIAALTARLAAAEKERDEARNLASHHIADLEEREPAYKATIATLERQNAAMRKMIEDAPHENWCGYLWENAVLGKRNACLCWKSRALASPNPPTPSPTKEETK